VAYVFSGNSTRKQSPLRAGGCSLEQGRRLYERFHCFPADRVRVEKCRRVLPNVLVRLGRLKGLIYSSDRGGRGVKTYIHFMNTPPMLACDSRGTQLYVVGGGYRITERGIEG
jgi:hypothetical protein